MDRDYRMYEPLFGSWHITKEIGSGAAGKVYEIERTDEFGVTIRSALKAITIPAGGEDEIKSVLFSGVSEEELKDYYRKITDNVANEFRCMTRLKGNSHIVSYEDHQIIAHKDDPGWDILLRVELLTPLHEYYQGRQMTETEILKMGADLCEGLELCRQYGIIHRDIKPANIFVAPSGDYKLGDFGIAKITETTQTFLSRKGTYTYMAPEVYRGEHYDGTADIYSLGMVLYQCLNDGRNLFMPPAPAVISHDDAEQAFAKRIVRHEIPLPAHGSEDLKRIVVKACAYDPGDRYQDAGQMREDLERLQRGESLGLADAKAGGARVAASAAGETGAGEPGDRPAFAEEAAERRRPVWRIIAVIAGILLACGAVIYAVIPHEIESIEGIEAKNKIYIGESMQPDYEILPDRFADEPITFTSSDEAVFRVDEKGRITAEAVGSGVLTMAADEYSRSVEVKVVPKVTAIEDLGDPIELETGDEKTLKPELKPEKFADEKIHWTVKDTSVAKVSKKGRVTAVAAGQTTLVAEAGGCRKEVSVKVTDPPAPVRTYYNYGGSGGSSGSSKKKSGGGSSGSKSSGGDKGYFRDSDKEYF